MLACMHNNYIHNAVQILDHNYFISAQSTPPPSLEFPYLSLGSTAGIDREYVGHFDDGVSHAIHIPDGFPFGDFIHSSVYVCKLIHWTHKSLKFLFQYTITQVHHFDKSKFKSLQ